MFSHARITLLACTVAASACHSSKSAETTPPPANQETIVRVDNRGFLDMTIYVLDGAQRVRLGTAPGNRITPLTIPPYLIHGAAPLRFLCDPIGGDRSPVSNELVVQPGDEVTLQIPPN